MDDTTNPTLSDVLRVVFENFNVVFEKLNTLSESLKDLHIKVDQINFSLKPLSRPELVNCTLVEENEDLLTNQKNGVYTWILYRAPGNLPCLCLIGSAHVALRYHVIIDAGFNRFFQFVTLPESVLQYGVSSVYFVNNTERMKNPLPSELDICIIETENVPTLEGGPQFVEIKTTPKHRRYKNSAVIGKSIGSYVSSQGGTVSLRVEEDGVGEIEFLLDVGEPGDSGTLLHVKDPDEDKYLPIAIFSGLSSSSTLHQKCGRAGIIPPYETMKKFNVTDASQIGSTYSHVLLQERHGTIWCELKVDMSYTNAVILDFGPLGPQSISGVFVETDHPIHYTGDLDIATMNQSWMTLDRKQEAQYGLYF